MGAGGGVAWATSFLGEQTWPSVGQVVSECTGNRESPLAGGGRGGGRRREGTALPPHPRSGSGWLPGAQAVARVDQNYVWSLLD